MEYKILTPHRFDGVGVDDAEVALIIAEQQTELTKRNLSYCDVNYLIERNGNSVCVSTIYDAIQCLALKEGADLVQFDDGKIGFVGYYSNRPIIGNHFKIKCAENEIISKYGSSRLYQVCKAIHENKYNFEYSDDEYIEDIVEHLNYKIKVG